MRKAIRSVTQPRYWHGGRRLKKLAVRREEIEWGELRVLLEDEGHLRWGEVCGRGWGKRNVPLVVPMTNERPRQTYYGALHLLTHAVQLQEGAAGDGENTWPLSRGVRVCSRARSCAFSGMGRALTEGPHSRSFSGARLPVCGRWTGR